MNKKPFILILCLFFMLVILPGGIRSASDNFPTRIISLGPTLTENLYLLNAQSRLIANTTYCLFPPGAEKKIKIGDMTRMNIEKIYSLRPDLVLCTSLSDPLQVKKLQKLGIRTYTFVYPKSFGEMCGQFLKLGELTGEKERALKIIERVQKQADSLRIKKLNPKPRVLIQIGIKPLFTVSKESFINDFILFAGGENITADAGIGITSREKAVHSNPDVIIITSMGIEGETEKRNWEKSKNMNAVINKKIYLYDTYKLCSPTIVTFMDTLKDIIWLIYKKDDK